MTPRFNTSFASMAAALLGGMCASTVTAQDATKMPVSINQLTDAEKKAGWKLLFDGHTTKGWHNFKQKTIADGWKVADGCLTMAGNGGDIVSDDEFESFELSLEWKICPGGNSGIFFHVQDREPYKYVWETAPEMQVLDNAKHADGKNPLTSAGSNYALHKPEKDATRPVGEFNHVRIIADGDHVEHWLNGEKLLEYDLGNADWKKLVENSKFKAMPDYGKFRKGHIALQDHGDLVCYRNIKIRPIKKH
ncbi:MAG: hypothetical protein CHACPFDD_02900 [Phycisphaerae bacterium]|nr:hypothetical protein [Phycisphaerae bacterium]